jgi:methionine biosynthesis protein MetW
MLLQWLYEKNQCRGYGVEISPEKVDQCIKKNLNVIQADIDGGLSIFDKNKFDVVILSQALQATLNTEFVLQKISSLGKKVVVSIPNFGHWSSLFSLARGHMPVNHRLPFEWFNTPNLHFATIKDFEVLLKKLKFSNIKAAYIDESDANSSKTVNRFITLRCTTAIYQFSSPIS